MRWNMASPGAGTVRGLDTLLGVLQYKDTQKKRDERLEADRHERRDARAQDQANKDRRFSESKMRWNASNDLAKQKLEMEKLEFMENDHGMIYKSFNDMDSQESYDANKKFLEDTIEQRKEKAPGTETHLESILDNMPEYSQQKAPTMENGGITEYNEMVDNPAFQEYRDKVIIGSMAGARAYGQELEKKKTLYGEFDTKEEFNAAEKEKQIKLKAEEDRKTATHKNELEDKEDKDKYTVGDTRSFRDKGKWITQEYQDDGEWKQIGDSPVWKPDNEANKSLSLDDVNKRLTQLQKERTAIANKKGFSDLELLFGKDNPTIQDAVKKADVSGALKEYDTQIEYYESERNALTPAAEPPKPEAPDTTTKLPEGLTEDTIKEGMALTDENGKPYTREAIIEAWINGQS